MTVFDVPGTAPQDGPQDAGLFGPDSVTWRLAADPSAVLAGLTALLLQALHPRALAAVEAYSTYKQDPWGRLARTGKFMDVATFGTTDQAAAAGAIVRAVHARVRGVDDVTGLPYAADDPDLLRWIHSSYVWCVLHVFRSCGGSLTGADADRYVGEQVAMARLVGLDAAEVPHDVASLEVYLREVRPELRVTPAARHVAGFGIAPPMPLWVRVATPARLGWAGVASLAFLLLPPWARRMYGTAGLLPADLAGRAGGRALRAALLAVPAGLRRSPTHREALARMERAVHDVA